MTFSFFDSAAKALGFVVFAGAGATCISFHQHHGNSVAKYETNLGRFLLSFAFLNNSYSYIRLTCLTFHS